eukprot:5093106-Amphidinium_carterae.1
MTIPVCAPALRAVCNKQLAKIGMEDTPAFVSRSMLQSCGHLKQHCNVLVWRTLQVQCLKLGQAIGSTALLRPANLSCPHWVATALRHVSGMEGVHAQAWSFLTKEPKAEITDKAIKNAAHGLLLWKGRGKIPPELMDQEELMMHVVEKDHAEAEESSCRTTSTMTAALNQA